MPHDHHHRTKRQDFRGDALEFGVLFSLLGVTVLSIILFVSMKLGPLGEIIVAFPRNRNGLVGTAFVLAFTCIGILGELFIYVDNLLFEDQEEK